MKERNSVMVAAVSDASRLLLLKICNFRSKLALATFEEIDMWRADQWMLRS